MITCSSILARRISRTEEPGGLQPIRQRVSQDWSDFAHTQAFTALFKSPKILLIFCLPALSITMEDMLKYPTMTMNLPIFPYNYVSFCNIYFKVTLLGAIQGDISCVCVCVCVYVSLSVVSDSLRPHEPTRLLCPWNSPGKNTGVGGHSFL